MAAGTKEVEPQTKIRSMTSKVVSWIRFHNKTKVAVQILWLNYQGEEVLYEDYLPPGARYWQHTFATHCWIARNNETGNLLALNKRLVYIPTDSGPYDVDVHEPASLPWSKETHPRYPSSFKMAVRTLLMCHRRLWQEQQIPEQQTSLRRSARLVAKRKRLESDPLGEHLAALPPELVARIIPFTAPAGVLDLEHVHGEETLPWYDTLNMPG